MCSTTRRSAAISLSNRATFVDERGGLESKKPRAVWKADASERHGRGDGVKRGLADGNRNDVGDMGRAALVASHRKSSGFVCGHEAGAFRCEWPPSIGRLMTTKPEAFSCATSPSATTLDMVSADCVRANALPLVKASASAVSTSRGSAGVSLSSMRPEDT
jgi:hypothetical protein